MGKTKIIFSTKYLDDQVNYSFSNRNDFDEDSSILSFIFKDKKYFQEIVEGYLKNLGEKALNEFLKQVSPDGSLDKESAAQDITSMSNLKKSFTQACGLPRFSYYTCDTQNDPNQEVFAVPCWKEPSVEWMNALINEKAFGKLGKGDVLYLILHDKDVPGYSGKVFEILTPEKIEEIEKRNGKVVGYLKDGIWVQDGYEIRIIVFNHVSNAIVPKHLRQKKIA